MNNAEIITVSDLVKEYIMGRQFFRALNGITLSAVKGEFIGFVGPSGSGKTTLLNEELKTPFIFATHDEKVIGYLRRKILLNDGRIADDTALN